MTNGVNSTSRKWLHAFSKPSPFSKGDFTASKTLARNIQRFWNVPQYWAVINVECDGDGGADEGTGDFGKVIG